MVLIDFIYTAITFFGHLFHGALLPINNPMFGSCNPDINVGLDCSLFARRLLGESHSISFPVGT